MKTTVFYRTNSYTPVAAPCFPQSRKSSICGYIGIHTTLTRELDIRNRSLGAHSSREISCVEYAIDVETRVRRSHLSTCVEGRRCVNPLKSRVILKIRVFRALEHQPCPQERAFPRVISSSRRRAKIALASRFMLSFTSLPPDFIGVHSTGSYNTEPKCRFYQKLHCKLRLTNKSSFAS